MMRTILIDDETDALDALKLMLKNYCPAVEILGTATTVAGGVELIRKESPDLVFLDVEMPRGSGFEILAATGDVNYRTIFTTAYHRYAIQAIKANALDYLLKPINIEELTSAVEKASERQPDHDNRDGLVMQYRGVMDGKLPVFTKGAYEFIPLGEVLYLYSEGAYTHIVLQDRRLLSSRYLKQYETRLAGEPFFRVSRSCLANLSKVTKFHAEDGGTLEMMNGDQLSVARKKKTELRDILGI